VKCTKHLDGSSDGADTLCTEFLWWPNLSLHTVKPNTPHQQKLESRKNDNISHTSQRYHWSGVFIIVRLARERRGPSLSYFDGWDAIALHMAMDYLAIHELVPCCCPSTSTSNYKRSVLRAKLANRTNSPF
jgi:hypothetical protein